MRKVLVICFVFFLLISFHSIAFSIGNVSIFEGTIDSIQLDHITLNGNEYKLANPLFENDAEARYGFKTTYWVGQSQDLYQTDFNTLYGVGYVDKARVTLQDGIVRKIEVLDLQQ